jgi:malate/lactate dehydrogenase-like protein
MPSRRPITWSEGEMLGHPSHGVLRLPTLVARLDAGLIVSGREPTLEWAAPGALRVDGRNGFGPVVAGRVLAALLARAGRGGRCGPALSPSWEYSRPMSSGSRRKAPPGSS